VGAILRLGLLFCQGILLLLLIRVWAAKKPLFRPKTVTGCAFGFDRHLLHQTKAPNFSYT
jgi:hypothetical protein